MTASKTINILNQHNVRYLLFARLALIIDKYYHSLNFPPFMLKLRSYLTVFVPREKRCILEFFSDAIE